MSYKVKYNIISYLMMKDTKNNILYKFLIYIYVETILVLYLFCYFVRNKLFVNNKYFKSLFWRDRLVLVVK